MRRDSLLSQSRDGVLVDDGTLKYLSMLALYVVAIDVIDGVAESVDVVSSIVDESSKDLVKQCSEELGERTGVGEACSSVSKNTSLSASDLGEDPGPCAGVASWSESRLMRSGSRSIKSSSS